VLDRISAWRQAGLIDEATAERLRTAEADAVAGAAPVEAGVGTAVSAFFGPGLSIIEVFAYLGGAFLLAAWHVLAQPAYSGDPNPQIGSVLGQWLLPGAAFAAIGFVLARRSRREQRAAGVAFAIATVHAFVAASSTANALGMEGRTSLLLGGLAGALAAIVFRRAFASVLTQAALLGSAATFAATLLQWLDLQLFGDSFGPSNSADGSIRPILTIGWWLAWAIGFGLFARWERSRLDETVDADVERNGAIGRRVSLARFGGGLVAILGTAVGMFVSGDGGRVLAPWQGELTMLALSAVLIGVAIRFGASAYLYPGALGIVIALTDLNGSYIAAQAGTGLALLLEGLILIGAGFAADRLRRRVQVSSRTVPLGPEAEAAPATT
jgi:hypothetical protein